MFAHVPAALGGPSGGHGPDGSVDAIGKRFTRSGKASPQVLIDRNSCRAFDGCACWCRPGVDVSCGGSQQKSTGRAI